MTKLVIFKLSLEFIASIKIQPPFELYREVAWISVKLEFIITTLLTFWVIILKIPADAA